MIRQAFISYRLSIGTALWDSLSGKKEEVEAETDSDKGASRACPYTLTQRQEGSHG